MIYMYYEILHTLMIALEWNTILAVWDHGTQSHVIKMSVNHELEVRNRLY